MTSKDPLIRHAITPPAFDPRNDIHRERLVDAIHANIPRKLIAIGAPAGYGKTTLLADFAEHTELTVCWMRLSEADWDVMRFAELLATSLQTRFRRLKGEPDLETLATSSPEALAIAFASAIDEHIGETFVIALDNVHLVNQSKPVLALLDRLLVEIPNQVTVIAAGREILETSVLARLMAEGDLAGFGPHDLALTRQELVELSELMQGQELPSVEIDRLLEESRGWVTAIVMSGRVADLNSGTLFGGGRPMVYEFLASVVLNRQPDDLRRFALDASVLPVMMSSSCDRVLKRDDSRKYLGQLERKGLFVTASQMTPKTYEFHPLFREFLLESLESANPRRLASLRRAAADYYIEQGAPELAVDLLIDAGSISRAAKLAESSSKHLHDRGRWHTLSVWADRLLEQGANIPNLLLHLATQAYDKGAIERAEELLDEMEIQLTQSSPKDLRAQYQIARGFLSKDQGRFGDALEAVREVEAIYAKRADKRILAIARRLEGLARVRAESDFESGEALLGEAVEQLESLDDQYNLLAALVDLANVQYVLGASPQEQRTRRRVVALAREIGAPLPLAVALGNAALGSHEQGDFEGALRLGRESLKYAHQAASRLREAISMVRQADVFNDLGLMSQAADLYGDALTVFMDLDSIAWIRYCCLSTSVMHRRAGSHGPAHEWIKRALVIQESQEAPPETRIQLGALKSGPEPDQAITVLQSLLRKSRKLLDSRQVTQVYYFLGRAALSAGDRDAARSAWGDALDQAGAYGTEQYIASEVRFDDEALQMLKGLRDAGPTLATVVSRVETMRALAHKYQTGEEGPQASVKFAFRALGESRVFVDGRDASDLKPQAREIVFYLVDGKWVSRERLAEVFWPEQPSGKQTSNLHTAVHGIRRELGKELIQLDGAVYGISPTLSTRYDVAQFEHAVAVADRLAPGDPQLMFALTEAMNSYRGPFLPEFDSNWVVGRRRELELKFLDVLAAYSEEALVRDQPADAVNPLREALRIDPYRDDTNMRYMEALGRLNRRAEIVAHYGDYVRLLATELGLDPPRKVRELYDRLIS